MRAFSPKTIRDNEESSADGVQQGLMWQKEKGPVAGFLALGRAGKLPYQREYILCGSCENVCIQRIHGISGLMEVRMNSSAHDRDSGDAGLFEGHVISSGEKPKYVEAGGKS
jgi:hypothetical protein